MIEVARAIDRAASFLEAKKPFIFCLQLLRCGLRKTLVGSGCQSTGHDNGILHAVE